MEYSEGNLWATIIYNGESIRVPVYGKNTTLRNRVQSVVIMPNSNGRLNWLAQMGGSHIYGYSLQLDFKVTPAYMANVIRDMMWHDEVILELVTTDSSGNISTSPVYEAEANDDGTLSIYYSTQSIENIKAVALHIKENYTNGTDIMTEFTTVEENKPLYYKECPDNNHPHMIDLGLPSGTLWSCCNLGADNPNGEGNYFAWGETNFKTNFSMDSYSLGSWKNMVNIGTDIAGTQYDAATTTMGNEWRMPTRQQFEELIHDCEKLAKLGGTNFYGYTFKGPNGGSIFIPAAGFYYETTNISKYSYGFYWSSNIAPLEYETQLFRAIILYFNINSNGVNGSLDAGFRQNGLPIRPVATKKK